MRSKTINNNIKNLSIKIAEVRELESIMEKLYSQLRDDCKNTKELLEAYVAKCEQHQLPIMKDYYETLQALTPNKGLLQ